MNIESELKLLAGQIEERTETLCAIHKEPKVRQLVAGVLALDSLADMAVSIACKYYDNDEEGYNSFIGLLTDSCSTIHGIMNDMCDVKDSEQLIEDVCGIADLRRKLSDRLNTEAQDD